MATNQQIDKPMGYTGPDESVDELLAVLDRLYALDTPNLRWNHNMVVSDDEGHDPYIDISEDELFYRMWGTISELVERFDDHQKFTNDLYVEGTHTPDLITDDIYQQLSVVGRQNGTDRVDLTVMYDANGTVGVDARTRFDRFEEMRTIHRGPISEYSPEEARQRVEVAHDAYTMIRGRAYEIVEDTHLAPTEAKVVVLIDEEWANDQIATALNLSKSCIESYRYERIPKKKQKAKEEREKASATTDLLSGVGI